MMYDRFIAWREAYILWVDRVIERMEYRAMESASRRAWLAGDWNRYAGLQAAMWERWDK